MVMSFSVPGVSLQSCGFNLRDLLVYFTELPEAAVEVEVIARCFEEGGATKPGLQVVKHNEEDHLLNLAFLLPDEVRELVLQQGKLESVDGY